MALVRDQEAPVVIGGAGLMGLSYAMRFLVSGRRRVVICDTDPARVRPDVVRRRVESYLADYREAGRSHLSTEEVLDRLVAVSDWDDVPRYASKVGLCIESITEDEHAKDLFYAMIRDVVGPSASLATNTSSLNINRFSRVMRSASPGSPSTIFLAAHATNPPHLVRPLELVCAEDTFARIVEAWRDYLGALGWMPVVLNRFSPGFVLNALQFDAINTACLLLDKGEPQVNAARVDRAANWLGTTWTAVGLKASADRLGDYRTAPADLREIAEQLNTCLLRRGNALVQAGVCEWEAIDTVMRYGLGIRWATVGLLGGADRGGIPLFARIHRELMPALGIVERSDRLERMVRAGRMGPLQGGGFHAWDAGQIAECDRRLRSAFLTASPDEV